MDYKVRNKIPIAAEGEENDYEKTSKIYYQRKAPAMTLPYSDTLQIQYLNRLFDNTSNCYKFFWFQAIIAKVLDKTLPGWPNHSEPPRVRLDKSHLPKERTTSKRENGGNMRIKTVHAIYFSPCGSTARAVSQMARQAVSMLTAQWSSLDFTLPAAREQRYIFGPCDLVFFGTPIYAGRVPNKLMPFVRDGFLGNGALAVPVVTYGNRSFDDGLVELRNLLEGNGFHTIGAAAVVAKHSFSKTLGAGRPNEADEKRGAAFAGQVAQKAEQLEAGERREPVQVPGTDPPEAYYTPLGIDGKPAKFLKAVPKISEKCSKCPRQARFFDDEAFLSHRNMLEQTYTAAREAEYFL